MYSYGPPHMAVQKQDDQHEHTFSSYVRIRDVVLKTCQRRWTIGKSGERGSRIYVLPARHDDDDDDIYCEMVIIKSKGFSRVLFRFWIIIHIRRICICLCVCLFLNCLFNYKLLPCLQLAFRRRPLVCLKISDIRKMKMKNKKNEKLNDWWIFQMNI